MNVRSSVDYGQDDYSRRTSVAQGRNSLTPGSQPGSRPGSRAPSHHGSNVSLNSEDDGRRGSGVRRTSSMRSGNRGLRPTPMGFGSGVPRKTSTPADRKRTDSNSSTDRTPLSGRTRTPSGSGPRGSLQRTGSNIGQRGETYTPGQRSTAYSADGNKFGSSAALRDAVASTRGGQV